MAFRGETPFAAFATLRVQLLASPKENVREGAAIALTLLLRNASADAFHDVIVAMPVPFGTSFVAGTLYHDARRIEPNAFLGDGYAIAELLPDAQSAFIWKLRAEAGAEPIRIVPQIWAGARRVIGAEPIELRRVSGVGAAGDLAANHAGLGVTRA